MVQIDIEMPKYCYDCPCHNGENGRCNITGDSTYDKRPFDCPLKERKSKTDDLISRQVAIDAIRASTSKYTGFMGMEMYTDDDAVEAINGVPSTQPKWILCSERLPRYGESVLTWDGVAYCIEKRIPCIRDEHGEPIYSDWWVSDDYDELNSEYYPNLRDGACIAWMPLPIPYEGEQDDN